MRVLFVTHNFPRFPGDAAGSFVHRLAASLVASGHRVHVIAPWAAGVPATESVDGVSVERVRYGTERNMTIAYGGTMAESVRSSWSGRFALVGLLRAFRQATAAHVRAATRSGVPVDVVHAHWWFPAALALVGLRRLPPVVITMHGSDVRLAQGVGAARGLMRAVLQRAALRTAVSTWLADAASRVAPDARIHVAPMPVDASSFTPPPASVRRHGILFVGRLNRQKGVSDLLRALACPPLAGATLTLVGEGPDAAALRALAESLGVAPRVRWLGALAHPELPQLYREAALVAMPSTEEGLGLVAIEAQLCETPVVAYASGGLPDVVRMDSGGTLVTPGDIAAFADGLARMLDDSVRARAAGQDAREAMLALFSPMEVAMRYQEHYATAAASRSVAR